MFRSLRSFGADKHGRLLFAQPLRGARSWIRTFHRGHVHAARSSGQLGSAVRRRLADKSRVFPNEGACLSAWPLAQKLLPTTSRASAIGSDPCGKNSELLSWAPKNFEKLSLGSKSSPFLWASRAEAYLEPALRPAPRRAAAGSRVSPAERGRGRPPAPPSDARPEQKAAQRRTDALKAREAKAKSAIWGQRPPSSGLILSFVPNRWAWRISNACWVC